MSPGAPLVSLDRSDKQRAVALLHERGAFALRRSTDAVAEAMGLSPVRSTAWQPAHLCCTSIAPRSAEPMMTGPVPVWRTASPTQPPSVSAATATINRFVIVLNLRAGAA